MFYFLKTEESHFDLVQSVIFMGQKLPLVTNKSAKMKAFKNTLMVKIPKCLNKPRQTDLTEKICMILIGLFLDFLARFCTCVRPSAYFFNNSSFFLQCRGKDLFNTIKGPLLGHSVGERSRTVRRLPVNILQLLLFLLFRALYKPQF